MIHLRIIVYVLNNGQIVGPKTREQKYLFGYLSGLSQLIESNDTKSKSFIDGMWDGQKDASLLIANKLEQLGLNSSDVDEWLELVKKYVLK